MPYPMDVGLKRWRYKHVPNLLGGLNTSAADDTIEDTQAITLNNVIAKASILKPDTGYAKFGQVVSGQPQARYEFARQSGLVNTMLVTTKTLYKYSTTLSKWMLVKGTASTDANGAYVAGNTAITVDSAAGFSTGDLVGLDLDNGDQLQTTITVAGLVFTLADAIPVGRSIADEAAIIRAVVLDGSLDHQISACTIPASDWMVFTNGIDIVQRYNGTDCVVVPNLPSAGNTVCRAVVLYNTALFLLSTIEGGTAYAQRARRSDQTDPTNWTTGTAGFDDLLDRADELLVGRVLGPYLIIYRERSIARGSFVGSSGLNYWFETTVTTEGIMSTNAFADMGDYHIFIGHANIYEYRGDYNITPIGEDIYYMLFGYSSVLNPQYTNRMFATFVDSLNEVWICFVSTTDPNTSADTVLRYNVPGKFWYTRSFANHIIGLGFYTKTLSFIWDTLVGSWDDQTWKWNSKVITSDAQTVHLCSADTNQVYEYDYYSVLDDATVIAYNIETKDFAMADGEFRFDMIEMNIQGTGVLLSYSTDSGLSWNTMGTITENAMSRIRISKQFVADKVRFRWSGTDSAFALEWFGFSYKQESLY